MVVQSLENLEILEKSGNKILVRENLENLEKSGNFTERAKNVIEVCVVDAKYSSLHAQHFVGNH